MYVYRVVCYRVIAVPICKKCWSCLCIPLLLVTIRNTQWIMRLLYSLKFFHAGPWYHHFRFCGRNPCIDPDDKSTLRTHAAA